MQTRKLFYEDCRLRSFEATVIDCEQRGEYWAVTLDATAFYPEGGGQAGDTGRLNDVTVLDTREEGDRIFHICDAPLEVGMRVEGRLDWEARFVRMQNHTGEHMVSGVIHRRYGFHNVGFHMGSESVTIDFDGLIPPAALPEIEAEVNRAIWADLPVNTSVPSPEELPNAVYRSKRALPWPVRIVAVPGIDSCACCGVHVAGRPRKAAVLREIPSGRADRDALRRCGYGLSEPDRGAEPLGFAGVFCAHGGHR